MRKVRNQDEGSHEGWKYYQAQERCINALHMSRTEARIEILHTSRECRGTNIDFMIINFITLIITVYEYEQ